MKIRKVERFEIEGREFETLAKAQDYIDGEVNRVLTNALVSRPNNMLGVGDIVAITEVILQNRERFAELLSVEIPEDETKWGFRHED